MIIVMNPNAAQDAIDRVVGEITRMGAQPHLSQGKFRTIIGAVGEEGVLDQMHFSSLDGVASLFANRWLLLAGWTHYLAFDLLVGVWEVHDSRDRRIPHLLVIPCLALTFMFGPAGWLLYQLIRKSVVRSR